MSRWRGPLMMLGAAALWSSAGLGIKSLPFFPLATAGWRSIFALPILLASGAWREIRPGLLRRAAALATIGCYALNLILFVSATRLTTAANAILLQYTSPLWVIALSYPILKERPHRRDYLLAAGCLLGLVLFFLDRISPEGMLGMVLALTAGGTSGWLIVALRYQGVRMRASFTLAAVLYGNVACALICLPWMIRAYPYMDARHWWILAGLGTFQLGLAYILFTDGIRRLTALRATLLGLIEPVLNPFWVAMGSGEVPGRWAMIGGSILLACLLVEGVIPRRPEKAEA